MRRSKGDRFVLELPLAAERWQADVLDKRLRAACRVYNACVEATRSAFAELSRTRRWREVDAALEPHRERRRKDRRKERSAEERALLKERSRMLKDAGFDEFSMMSLAARKGEWAKHLLDCNTRQKIGSRLWRAWESVLFGAGEEVRFKGWRFFNTVEGKSNKSGIRLRDGKVSWLGLEIPLETEDGNAYEAEALSRDVAYVRIVRREVRGSRRFYAQLVLDGKPPVRLDASGRPRRATGEGRVGIDVGTRTIAVASESSGAMLRELAEGAQPHYRERLRVERAMDRSRRATNPQNFAPDGTAVKGAKGWKRSKRYEKLAARRRELYRKEVAVRRYEHELLSNEIVSMGDEYVVESMDFRALAKRAKPGAVRKDGRPSRRKRFGRSVGEKAPGMLVAMVGRKAAGALRRVDAGSYRASQLDHATGELAKKPLSKRWADVGGRRVQRDLYSAFLLMCASDVVDRADKARCDAAWPRFLEDHKAAIAALEGKEGLPSSMGLRDLAGR